MGAVKGIRVKLNPKGVRAILQSQEVADDLEKRGERIGTAAGPGHDVVVSQNRDRKVVFVRAETDEARRADAENHSLLRAIDAGR